MDRIKKNEDELVKNLGRVSKSTKIQQLGNDFIIKIPRVFATSIDMEKGDLVEFTITKDVSTSERKLEIKYKKEKDERKS